MKSPLRPLAVIFFLAAAAAVAVFYVQKDRRTDVILTTGIIEATEVNLSSEVAARVSYISSREGDTVGKGQVVIRLKNDDLRAAVEQAMAGIERSAADVEAAEAAVESSTADILNAEAEITRAQAQLGGAEARLIEAQRQLQRANSLYAENFIPKSDADLKQTAVETALSELEASKAGLDSAASRKDALTARLGAYVSQTGSSLARLKEAQAALSYHRARLEDTVISSPITGTVVFSAVREGEVVSPGSAILTIADLDDLWVRVDIEETLIGLLGLGDEAEIYTAGQAGKTSKGVISEIGRYAEFATQRDITRGRQDIKTFRVKIRVKGPAGMLKPGMTVDVNIPKNR
ncbi:MAG: efflux RND transporter periplasmic adaptor subunit [Thermodesulfovibrionales bacterium]|nr:efflux RND transporter periplasmic adaptor subunit [Thermodesulfovibrionales bacterium]